jgi:AcrR family transcriptional regulator
MTNPPAERPRQPPAKARAEGRASRADGRITRERLLTAGIELMAEGGRSAVTLVGVAQRAGVARGTAHHHFASRQALLAEVEAGIGQALLKLADGAHHFKNPYGLALRLAVEDESIIRTRIYRILDEGPLSDPRTVNLLNRLAAMDQEGLLRPGIDARSAALISAALDFAGLMAIALGRTPEERRALTRRLSDTWHEVFTHGVVNGEQAEGNPTDRVGLSRSNDSL